jgi:trimethylamine---corrinoid protein Co-methyltransferase
LKHSETAMDKLIFCSEKRIPLIYTPAPSAGGTAPVTLAGTLALATAEVLTGLVLNQLISEGAPFIYGGVLSILDMKTMDFCYGAPEFYLFTGALADMARYYKLPSFTTGGVSDSKTFDAQAASEYAFSLFASYMSSSDLIHDVGFIESGMTCSFEGILFGNELIDLIKRVGRGIEVNDETLAYEVIKKEGVGGFFLDNEHTINNFKKEHWFPSILDRFTHSQWEDRGSEEMFEVLNNKTLDIIKTHEGNRLDADTELNVKEYLKSYYNIDRE